MFTSANAARGKKHLECHNVSALLPSVHGAVREFFTIGLELFAVQELI
jgi:hypothetical protein